MKKASLGLVIKTWINCTFNLGTKGGGMLTEVGNNSLFMAGVHIAHDCIVKIIQFLQIK